MAIYDELFLAVSVKAKPAPISVKAKPEQDQSQEVVARPRNAVPSVPRMAEKHSRAD
jgi:hypothetical protein